MTAPLLILGGAAMAAPFWHHHRARNAPRLPDDIPDVGITALWDAHVAAPNHALPGAALTHAATFEHGDTYRVQLVPGRQSLATAHSGLPLIATGLRMPLDEIVIEQDPDTTDPSQLRMQVITRSPIRDTVLFDRPRFDGGRIHLGPHADGIGDATYRLYTRNSMWGGFVLGSIGSGKSRLVESIALTAQAMGHTTIFYVDGQDGASSSVLWRHAARRAGADDSGDLLTIVEQIARDRQAYNVTHELSGFTPGPDRKGILIVVDECHIAFGKHPDRWADVARTVRKLGLAVLAVDQDSSLRTFGNLDVLRSSLLAGNAAALRTTSRMAGHLIPGLELDPYELPALPGYGYTVAAKGSDARTAPFRARYLPDRDDKADDPTITVPSVQEWFETVPAVHLDAAAQRSMDVALMALEVIAKRKAGKGTGGDEDIYEAMGLPVAAVADVDETAGQTMAQRILELFADRDSMELPGIYNALPGESLRTIRYALKSLVDRGQLVRPGEGIYARAS